MSKKNIITIDGRQYDSMTGQLIGGSKPDADFSVEKITKSHTVAKHAVVHNRQNSKTLMRHAVKKPSPSSNAIKSNGAIEHKHASTPSVVAKHSAHKINKTKLSTAQKIQKSQQISRFSKNSAQATAAPKPVSSAASKKTVNTRKKIVSRPRTTAELLEHAIARSTSHEATYTPDSKKFFKRLSRNSALALSVGVLIISVVAIKAIPFIKTKSASANAGFSVVIPKHQPSGFSITKLDAKPGTISINYKSNSDSRSFVVTEQVSNWSDEALRAKQSNSSVLGIQAINTGSKTIYIDSDYNAKWIDSGIYYSVDGSGVLSTKQIVEIANSL